MGGADLSLREVAAVRLVYCEVGQLRNRGGVGRRVIARIYFTATRNVSRVSDARSGVVGNRDSQSNRRVTRACGEHVAASTGQRSQHTSPTSAADGGGGQPGR